MLERVNKTMGRMMIAGDTSCWDYGFLESLSSQLEKGSILSNRQIDHLQQIEGRWSDEALASIADWTKSWNEEKEANFLTALIYYKKQGYYSAIVAKYLDVNRARCNGNPSEKEYVKLVDNKYAAAVISNMSAPIRFPVGSACTFRDSYQVSRPFRGLSCIVLKYGDVGKVTSHALDAIPLQVLPVGKTEPYWTEVRYLKKLKLSKK